MNNDLFKKVIYEYSFLIHKDDIYYDKNIEKKKKTHLTLKWCFTMKRDILPEYLKSIIFPNNFNQVIDKGILPKNLTHLLFGTDFNQIINEEVLPQNLTQK